MVARVTAVQQRVQRIKQVALNSTGQSYPQMQRHRCLKPEKLFSPRSLKITSAAAALLTLQRQVGAGRLQVTLAREVAISKEKRVVGALVLRGDRHHACEAV
jgi:hypothetical protein